MRRFDLDAARREGYSDDEIAEYLAAQRGFDLKGALAEGYLPTEIITHLTTDRRGTGQKVLDFLTPAKKPELETTPAAETALDSTTPDLTDYSRAGMERWTGGKAPPTSAAPDVPLIHSATDAELGQGAYSAPTDNREGEALRAIVNRLGQGAAEIPGQITNLLERSPELSIADPVGWQRRLSGVRRETVLTDLTRYFDEKAKWWEARVPGTYKEAERKEWVTDDFRLGEAWSDPKSYLMGVTGSIPATIAMMLPGLKGAEAVYARLAPRLGAEGAAVRAAAVAAMSGRLAEGALEGSQNDIEARKAIESMTREQLDQSSAYRDLVKGGMSPQVARAALANDVGLRTLVLSGVATGIFSGSGDKLMAKAVLRGLDGNVVSRVLRGALAEGLLEEAPQGFFGAIGKNIAMGEAVPDTPLLKGALNEAVGGAVAGGIIGGAMAAPFGRPAERAPTASEIDITTMPGKEAIQAIANAPVTPIADIAPPPGPPTPPAAGAGIIGGAMGLEDMGLSAPAGGPDARTVVDGQASQPVGTAAPGAAPGAAIDQGGVQPPGAGVGVVAPAAPGQPGGQQGIATEDFQTRRGELKVFPTEDAARAYADSKTNRVPGTFKPRQTETGEWVLSRQPRERTEAQKANDARLRRQRNQVAPEDNLGRAIAKLGGIKAEDLESDGADPADLRTWRSGIVGKPTVRRKGGLSLDALAELLAGHGFDVTDPETGNPDASKLRDLIDEELAGTQVFTPEGHEVWAGREDELRAQAEAAAAADIPDEELSDSGYNDLSEDARDAIADAVEADADEDIDAIDEGAVDFLGAGGRPATDEDIDAIFGKPPAAGGIPQAGAPAGAGQGDSGAQAPAPVSQGEEGGEVDGRADQDVEGDRGARPASRAEPVEKQRPVSSRGDQTGRDEGAGVPPTSAVRPTQAEAVAPETPAPAGVSASGKWDFDTTFPRPLAEAGDDLENSMFAGLEGEELEDAIRDWHGDAGAEIGAKISRKLALERFLRDGIDPKTGKPPKDPEKWRADMASAISGVGDEIEGSFQEYETEFGPEAAGAFRKALDDFYGSEDAVELAAPPPKKEPPPKKLTKKQREKAEKERAQKEKEEAEWEDWRANKKKENELALVRMLAKVEDLRAHLDEAPAELRPLYRALYERAGEEEATEFIQHFDSVELYFRHDRPDETPEAQIEAMRAAYRWAFDAWLTGDERVLGDVGEMMANGFGVRTPAGDLWVQEWDSIGDVSARLRLEGGRDRGVRRDEIRGVPFTDVVDLFGYDFREDGKKSKVPKGVLWSERWRVPSSDGYKNEGKPVTIKSARTIDGDLYAIDASGLSGSHNFPAVRLTPADEWEGKTYPTIKAVMDSWNTDEPRRGQFDGLEVTYRGAKYVMGGAHRLILPTPPTTAVTRAEADEAFVEFEKRAEGFGEPVAFGPTWKWDRVGDDGRQERHLLAVKIGGKVYIESVRRGLLDLWERGVPGAAPPPSAKKAERPTLDLAGETEAEIRAREERERLEREKKAKREAAPEPADFVLAGSNRPVDQARARGQMELAPAAPGGYERFKGRTVTEKVPVEGGGEATLERRADEAMQDIDNRIRDVEELLVCLK